MANKAVGPMGENKKTNGHVDDKKKSSRGALTRFYLLAYNITQTIGWTMILYKLISYYLVPNNGKSLYDVLSFSLMWFQNAAVLEVFHAATGMVKSSAIMTAFQVGSRVAVVCGVLLATNEARLGLGLPMAVLAWSLTEIIRYSNYACALFGSTPYFLKYLRYTLFIILYPIGITGELTCIYKAQCEVGEGQLYSIDMPNKYNFTFNYQHLLWFLMILYVPLFPQLYMYMFGQRKKALQKEKSN
ncbi:very-long-chain (3R)-3-hydroxyacyl-CoA dehydratase hpo-8 [Anthonomus grandis grandis]|uniref:very-long-chain (3R)-3-hydroxyacyl-CoA dehydratase hpo-8 n=1 Tax=Anthonomus grandis grandis TaxID=2921223 RepID=UPI0021669A50|nr:very-long-chain (3R)-3-hydroxyacyl-CoA dehydratase hpo-8 [Anthonomus grandis grandis]